MLTRTCDRTPCPRTEPEGCDARFITVELAAAGEHGQAERDGDCYCRLTKHFCSMECLMHWAAAQPVEGGAR